MDAVRRSPFAFAAGLIVACALSRLIPHPPNFSPIEATALFAGAVFATRWLAVAVPIAAMLLSDLVLGFHAGVPVVYATMAAIALAGRGLRGRPGLTRLAGYGVGSALVFFAVTNFFVWASSGMYPLDLPGLVACYVAAIPFFANQLMGVAFYGALLFGLQAWFERRRATATAVA